MRGPELNDQASGFFVRDTGFDEGEEAHYVETLYNAAENLASDSATGHFQFPSSAWPWDFPFPN
jgi:hypothetical protein